MLFSFDEMGKYDIPAALAYVLKNQPKDYSPKVFYIGHSMGTTMFWVAMNEHQKFMEDSVHMMVAMGPVAYVGNVESPITLFSPFLHQIETLFKWLGIREFRPSNAITRWFEKMVCDQTMVQLKVCENYLFLITGYDSYQMNMVMKLSHIETLISSPLDQHTDPLAHHPWTRARRRFDQDIDSLCSVD